MNWTLRRYADDLRGLLSYRSSSGLGIPHVYLCAIKAQSTNTASDGRAVGRDGHIRVDAYECVKAFASMRSEGRRACRDRMEACLDAHRGIQDIPHTPDEVTNCLPREAGTRKHRVEECISTSSLQRDGRHCVRRPWIRRQYLQIFETRHRGRALPCALFRTCVAATELACR